MAQATVKTVQYLDPRIEPQPDPVYDYVIGPTQNQYYKIPASGKSNSSLTFNNLTTLGIDRAYLDTFELELQVRITFEVENLWSDAIDGSLIKRNGQHTDAGADMKWTYTCTPAENEGYVFPNPNMWTFDSFPFNKCCDEARVNINGGAFFSQPMSYIRAKERYMNQAELSKCYENICPIHRPNLQYESGLDYSFRTRKNYFEDSKPPSRYGYFLQGYNLSDQGITGGTNMDILRTGKVSYVHEHEQVEDSPTSMANYFMVIEGYDSSVATPQKVKGKTTVITKWREPVFCSPFSSRYDATYGRPLYNITSMDLAFTMQDLGNMIRLINPDTGYWAPRVTKYSIEILSANLCYQVMTIPPILNKPLTTLVPYRRFVPYITDYNQTGTKDAPTQIPIEGTVRTRDPVRITSGVYTFNEIPTAIWLFVAPQKSILQTNQSDKNTTMPQPVAGAVTYDFLNTNDSYDSNKLFGYITHVNLTMANTTQILNTAEPEDLYRIAKANGCEDSFISWNGWDAITTNYTDAYGSGGNYTPMPTKCFPPGSVLRLKPGVDLIVPDQPLIPGANANNMVFQAEVTAQIPPHAPNQMNYSLWLLFEYVGVAAISPGQCEITMNPLGSGEIMAVSPVMSATSEATEGAMEGSGFWDRAKKHTAILGQLADDGIISMILKRIPGAKGAYEWAQKHGLGEPAQKRGRGGACNGGAVIGKGLNDWV